MRGPQGLSAALLCLAIPGLAWAQGSPGPDTSAADRAGAGRAVQDAIPITPDMIRELARRYQENSRTQEETLTPVASPNSRPIAVSFAPGCGSAWKFDPLRG